MRTEEDKRGKKGILPVLIYIFHSSDQFMPFLEKIREEEVNSDDERSFFAIAGVKFRWHRNFRAKGDRG